MYDIKPATITVDSAEYEMELGKVEKANLGLEDHNIFGFNIAFNFKGSGQGTGWYALVGTDAANVIKGLIRVFGVREWADIPGKELYVLRESSFGQIKGLFNHNTGRVVMIADLFGPYEAGE